MMMLAFAANGPVDAWLRDNPWVIPLFIVAWGWFLTQGIARLSGWARLADQYLATRPFEGEKWRFQSIQMRYLTHYNNCVTFGADPEGLYMAMFFLLRPGHPPLLVPWQELEVQPRKRFLVSGYELHFLRAPEVTMWVRGALGEKIVRAAAQRGAPGRVAPQIG